MVGLVTSLRLAQRGCEVVLFEKDDRGGGLAASFEPCADGDSLERFYHHVFRSDTRFVSLCAEMDLGSDLTWVVPQTSCFFEGAYGRLDSAGSLLAFAPLPLLDRLRLAGALAFLKAMPSPERLERLTATAWLRRYAGARAYEVVFAPLFASKFGRFAKTISLAWFWARIHDRTTALGYVRGGFERLYRRLADRVRAAGASIEFGATITKISESPGGDRALRLRYEREGVAQDQSFDAIVSTLPLRTTAAFASFPQAYLDAHGGTDFLMARCLILALDRPLTGRYWVNVCDPGAPFMVVVEHTQLIGAEHYGGKHIVYLGNYAESFERVEARELIAHFTPYLRALNPEFSLDWIISSWQFVAPNAQPVVTPGYRARMPPLETPVSGLYLASLEQVYPHDRGQNYAIELAERVSKRIGAT